MPCATRWRGNLAEQRVVEGYAPAIVGALQQDQLLWIAHRQRPRHHRVQHPENGGIRADAEGQRQHGSRGEAGIGAQLAQSMAQVLGAGLQQRQAALVSPALSDLRNAAELAPRLEVRPFRRHAAALVVRGQQFDVAGDLLLYARVGAGIAAVGGEESSQPGEEYAQRHHDSPSSIRLTMATVRDQLWASVANCLRPNRVME